MSGRLERELEIERERDIRGEGRVQISWTLHPLFSDGPCSTGQVGGLGIILWILVQARV